MLPIITFTGVEVLGGVTFLADVSRPLFLSAADFLRPQMVMSQSRGWQYAPPRV